LGFSDSDFVFVSDFDIRISDFSAKGTSMKHRPNRRAGFTLIEILIVVAIIAILVSLLMAGVFYAYGRMKETGANSDISQMTASLQAFKAKFGVYPPSRIRLCSNYARYSSNPTMGAGGSQLDADSITFLNRMWPNIGAFSGINWAGNGNPVDEILDGDQCLVFFLGGIPNPIGTSPPTFNDSWGFSVNPKDPSDAANPNTKVGKIPPFFAFSTSRLFVRNPNPNPQNFASYKDYYNQQPYLYFSAFNRKNGYNPSYFVQVLNVQPYFSVAPAANSLGQFFNPDSGQIICAGADGVFGPGGQWTSATAEIVYPTTSKGGGADDLTNFHSARMGVSQ
jgi:prepilin-type N-terminal cleavage/methylation domain-containing protein